VTLLNIVLRIFQKFAILTLGKFRAKGQDFGNYPFLKLELERNSALNPITRYYLN